MIFKNRYFASCPALIVALAGVSKGQLADPIPTPIPKSAIGIELQTVADNLVAPNYLAHAGDGTDRLFVVDQGGEVRLIKDGQLQSNPYLDVSSNLVDLGVTGGGGPFNDFDERGLLGIAFHPDFASDVTNPGYGKFYTYTSEPVSGPADFTVPLPAGEAFDHQSVVREWHVDPREDVITANPASISREVMRIDEPQSNHNGATLAFGPDGQLYLSIGDGGAADDNAPGHGPDGNGQNTTSILGSVVRFDPLGSNSANGQYGIPADNPFVNDSNVLDEIYAYGLRNPFRFAFDVDPATGQVTNDTTGQLVLADVGQNNIEEVDIITAGGNFGWRLKEGSFAFDPINGTVSDDLTGLPNDLIDPVLEYDHDEGTSIIGGFVYRGSAIPELVGKYVFGDFSLGFAAPAGRLFVGDLTTGEIEELLIGLDARELGLFVKGFGQDADGELYLLAGTNIGPFRDDTGQGFGQVLRIVAIPEPTSLALLAGAALLAVQRRRA